MRQDGNIPSHDDTEEEILESCRRHVMRWFDQYIARIGQCEQSSGGQARNNIRDDVIVCTSHQTQRHPRIIEHVLQIGYGLANLRSGIVIEPRQNMWGARHDPHAVGNEQLCHGDGGLDVRSTVVDARQNMIMQIDHDL